MNWFYNNWKRINGYELVKNASPSPSYNGNLLVDWETYMKRTASNCARCGDRLQNDKKVGGHVLKEPHSLKFDYYVVPLCSKCNHTSVDDAYWVKKSEMARLIDIVHAAQE